MEEKLRLFRNAYFLTIQKAKKGTLTKEGNFIELKLLFENDYLKIDLFDQRNWRHNDKWDDGTLKIFSKEKNKPILFGQKYPYNENISKYGERILGFSVRDYIPDKRLEDMISIELNKDGSGAFAGILPELICNLL